MMTVDCKWMDANFEAYCCDRLIGDELEQARRHIANCESCRSELRAISEVDPLVQQVFRHRLAVARSPQAPRRLMPAAAAVGLAGGMLAFALIMQLPTQPVETLPPLAPQASVEQVVPKEAASEDITRAKPDATTEPAPRADAPSAPAAASSVESFAVIDPAGYVRRLEDYRGYVLVVGVWSPAQAEAVRNLEQVYRTFTRDTNFRLVGVSNRRQEPPAGITFPIAYNDNSQLLGAQESQFVVIDRTGTERLRGSLVSDTSSLTQTLRTLLGNN